jgi:hypothetical protein
MSKKITSVVFTVDGVEKVCAVKTKEFNKTTFENAWAEAFNQLKLYGYTKIVETRDYGNNIYHGYGSLDGEPATNDYWLRVSTEPNCYVFEGI